MTSIDGSRIPITDDKGALWTIDGGWVYRNGVRTSGQAKQMVWVAPGGTVPSGIYVQSPKPGNHWYIPVVVANKVDSWKDVGVVDPAPAVIPPPPPAQAVVTFNAASMNAGSPMSVSLAGGGGNAKDWLTIAKVTNAPEAFGAWVYTPTAAFTWQTTIPAIGGQYEVRFFLNNSFVVAAKSLPFTVVVPYAAPVFSFPASLAVSVGVPISLLQYVSSALPLVFDPIDDADKTLTVAGLFTAKRVATGTVSSAVDDGH